METRLNVGIVTTSYPRNQTDYAGLFVARHQAWLAQRHTTHVVAAGTSGVTSQPNITRVSAPSGLFYQGGAPDALEASFKTLPGAIKFCVDHKRTVHNVARNWDCAFAHWIVPSALSLPARLPAVVIAHSGDVHVLSRVPALARWVFAKLVQRKRTRFVFVTHGLRNRAIALTPHKHRATIATRSIVCPMGADRVSNERGAPRHYLYLGRLTAQKGVWELAQGFIKRPRSYPLVIAGDGPLAPQIAALCQQTDSLRYVGPVYGTAKQDVMRHAKGLIIPSRRTQHGRSEGAPVVALEAIVSGIPVLAAPTGGLLELPVTRADLSHPSAIDASICAWEHHASRPPANPYYGWEETGARLWEQMQRALADS